MKKLFNLIIFILFIAFLYMTCPDDSAHVEALSEALPEYFSEQLEESGLNGELSNLKEDPESVRSFFLLPQTEFCSL